MNYNHPLQQKAVRWLHLAVGFLFCIFCYGYLWKVQGSLLGMAQHILSAGQTVYIPMVGALVLTITLLAIQKVVNWLLRTPIEWYALSYYPSFLGLAFISWIPVNLAQGLPWYDGFWVGGLLIVLYVGVMLLVRQARTQEYHGSGAEVQMLLPNLLALILGAFLTLGFGNTDRLLAQQTEIERALCRNQWEKALQVATYRQDCNATTQALRAYSLARQGQLADHLFEYPQPYGSEGLWINRQDSLFMQFSPDSLYFNLGAYPSAQTPTAIKFLQYLNLSKVQCKPMARDYLLCAYLLDKDLPGFIQELEQQQGIADSMVYPVHYQQALVLYKHRYDPDFAYDNQAQEQHFAAYQQLLRSTDKQQQAAGMTQPDFGKTYWWYYDCYRNKE